MTMEKPGMPRRHLLRTAAVGVPAMGALSAVNLFGAPAAKAARLRIDGVWGTGTSLALEEFLGRVVFPGARLNEGGWIRSQAASWAAVNPGLGAGWEWVPDKQANGSATIALMQRWLGVGRDGLIGPSTIRALQAHYGKVTDGVLDDGSPTIAALQDELNRYL